MKFRNIIACGVVAVAMAACTAEEPGVVTGGETTGGLTIVARATDLMPQIVLSRADVGPEKRAEEKEIKSLHLFFFNADGSPLKAVNPSVFDFYKKVVVEAGKQPAQNMPSGAFVGQSGLTNVTVVAVANIFGDSFRTENNPDGDIVHGDPTDANAVVVIDNISKLKSWLYRIEKNQVRKDVSKLPEPGMPMFGILEGVDLSKEQGAVAIPMQALMARVDVNVKLDANQTSHDHQLPTLHITKYGVANMPGAVPFFIEEPSGYTTDTSVGSGLYNPDLIDVSATQPIMYDGQEAQSFSYYTYENIQLPAATPNYPDGVNTDDDSEIQRWKPTIAPENASNLVMHGHYVTHQGLQYDAQFTVYLGENTYNDFEVHRNRAYINNIVIKGLDYVRNDDDTRYTFDGRVNVKTDNPVYISIVNERKLDAHWNVVPMDVYLLRREAGETDLESYVDISIDPAAQSWLKMEKVDSTQMYSGDFSKLYDGVDVTKYISRKAVEENGMYHRQPGNGARKYFTTDLLNDPNLKTSLRISGPVDKSRTRIYFYVDENVSTQDRTATITVVYNNKNNDRRERTLEFDQRGLLLVNGTSSSTTPFYIEYYEEYIDHRDPLDQHEQDNAYYDGLPWARTGAYLATNVVLGRTWGRPFDAWEVYDNGLQMTNYIFENLSNRVDSISNMMTYPESIPASVFHYCYAKNKRNADGTIAESNWYMPGIRELESAITTYYSTFNEFQDNYYWSASAAKTGTVIENENSTYARATMYRPGGTGENNWVQSGSPDNEDLYTGRGNKDKGGNHGAYHSGKVPKTIVFRVRACRRANGVSN